VNGFFVTKDVLEVRRSIGYMPDSFGVYDGMRVYEFLDFFALAYGIRRQNRVRLVEDVLRLLDLTVKRDAPVNALSRGMKQRLCLAKTLVHDPPVLVLDEPASGLDPRARIEIKELLRELGRMGKTILVSSHILHELRDCCHKVGFLERGKLLAAGPVEDVLKMAGGARRIELVAREGAERAWAILSGRPFVGAPAREGSTIRFEWEGPEAELPVLLKTLMDDGVSVLSWREVERSLEEAFLRLTRGEVA
jgi:ABC-2 type transport system ATP-binding protein